MGKNLVKDKHPPEDMQPGQPRREDYTYEKKGAGNVFIACEPLAGRRSLKVSKRRTKKDWASFMQELLTEHYAQAEKVVLVMDNLNTHSPASFYEVFPPEEAKALADRLEIHSTPKHASWLNIAEIELSVLVRQGLARNIATMQEFCEQVEQWQTARNQAGATVHWQFTTTDARIKLERLYPLYTKPSGTAPSYDNSSLTEQYALRRSSLLFVCGYLPTMKYS
jgi:DDE superfamily endonuclease